MPSINAFLGFEAASAGAPQVLNYTLRAVQQITAWQITDAWGEVDDTIRLTFHDGRNVRGGHRGRRRGVRRGRRPVLWPLRHQVRLAVVPAFNEYTVHGRKQDRRFEHTALDAWEALADEAGSHLSPASPTPAGATKPPAPPSSPS